MMTPRTATCAFALPMLTFRLMHDLGRGPGLRLRRDALARVAFTIVRAIGQAERALEALCRRSTSREAFGRPLVKLGANYDIIAECRMEIEMAFTVLKAAWMMDTHGVAARSRSLANQGDCAARCTEGD